MNLFGFIIITATVVAIILGIGLGLHAQLALMLIISIVAVAVGFTMPYDDLPGLIGAIYVIVVGALMITAWITFFVTQPDSEHLLHNIGSKLFR